MLNKMAASAINRNKLLMTSAKSVDRDFKIISQECSLGDSTEIAQTVPLL